MSRFQVHDQQCCYSIAKPSRPARAYLHLTRQEYLSELSEKVRDTLFEDAKASGNDPALSGPPSVEFTPYGRIPNGRLRKDARQGTIDQDQEFIDFLESLTNPVIKPFPGEGGSDTETKKGDKAIVTPLIQYLRDKQLNKAKENVTTAKPLKHVRQDSKESKSSQGSEKKTPIKPMKDATPLIDKRSAQAIKVEKAARDAVRLLNKQANNSTLPTSPIANNKAAKLVTAPVSLPAPLADKKRERGNASAAARILQRDLGIGANSPGKRGGRREAGISRAPLSSPQANTKMDALNSQPSNTSKDDSAIAKATSPAMDLRPSTVSEGLNQSPQSTNEQPPTGPAATRSTPRPANRNKPNSSRQTIATATRPPAILSTPSLATQAFLKHANPSQGITEPLLEEAFSAFGAIDKVEIDKRKGFAYVDFTNPEGLQNAIKASPVKIAQGQVVVLERKTGPTLQIRNIRGGGAMNANRGGILTSPRGGRGSSMRGRGSIGRGGVVQSGNGGQPATTVAIMPAPDVTESQATASQAGSAIHDPSLRPITPTTSITIPTTSSGSPVY